jgi:SAM-dependent methyltransferase
MVSKNLIEQWKKDEVAPFKGWDFSYLRNRKNEDKEPWDYKVLAKELVQKSTSVLDMGTGGGEIFSSLAPFPKHAVAIEGYKPNVKVARERLEPLGVKVLEVDESYELPFTDGEFDLVLNRHSAFTASEVFRILKPGGYFLTQQVGGGNLNDLISIFDAVPKYKDWALQNIKDDIKNAGLKIKDAREWKGTIEFKDVGAIVYFLKAIPWIVEGFSVKSHLQYLEQLQAKLDEGEKLVFMQVRFLVLAQKI